MNIFTNNSEIKVGDIVSTTDSDFAYDEGYNCFDSNPKDYCYEIEGEYLKTEYDDMTARNQGGSSGNYSYRYYKVLKIFRKEYLKEEELELIFEDDSDNSFSEDEEEVILDVDDEDLEILID